MFVLSLVLSSCVHDNNKSSVLEPSTVSTVAITTSEKVSEITLPDSSRISPVEEANIPSDEVVIDSLTLTGLKKYVDLEVSSLSINLFAKPGKNPPPEQISFRCRDYFPDVSFSWSLTCDVPWLSVSPSGGTLLPPRAYVDPIIINVAADTAGLSPGSYRGTVSLSYSYQNPGFAPRQIQVSLFVSDYEPGQVLAPVFSPGPGNYLTEGIFLENASVAVVLPDRPYTFFQEWGSPYTYSVDDLCFKVDLTIRNDTGSEWQIGCGVKGYGDDPVRAMNVHLESGLKYVNIPAGSSRIITVYLSFTGSLDLIVVSAGKLEPQITVT